jgi:hypothetical protein
MEGNQNNEFYRLSSSSMSEINPVTNSGATPMPHFAPQPSGVAENSDGAQLSKLSSVLNGLDNGAARMRTHLQQAMGAVRSGSYRVDALKLSRRIVGEAMGWA